jgi:hypothetical protein
LFEHRLYGRVDTTDRAALAHTTAAASRRKGIDD